MNGPASTLIDALPKNVDRKLQCLRNQSIEMKRTPATDGIWQKLFQTCHKVPEKKKRRKDMFKTNYVTENAYLHTLDLPVVVRPLQSWSS